MKLDRFNKYDSSNGEIAGEIICYLTASSSIDTPHSVANGHCRDEDLLLLH